MRNTWIMVLALGCSGSDPAPGDTATGVAKQLDRLEVIGATPVKKTPAGWAPACYGGAEALRVAYNLRSTDGDQIRPGDRVGDSVIGEGSVVLLPVDPPLPPIGGSAFIDAVPRDASVAVAVLVDQSGSMSGLVDRDTCLEGSAGSFDQGVTPATCASDVAGLRLVAAEALVASAGGTVYQFSEAAGCAEVAENDALQGTAAGRSNLWACVQTVHALLAARPEAAKHLVVITDGPDTCSADSEDFQRCFTQDEAAGISHLQEPCQGVTSFDEARQTLESGSANVHVSFIQFQSKGYPAPDARMIQAACLSGGHHELLRFNEVAAVEERREGLLDAVARQVTALRGVWSVAVTPASSAKGQAVVVDGVTFEGRPKATYVAACAADADCGAPSDCGPRCSPATATCRAPANGADCPGGVCCDGECAAGKTICPDLSKGTPGAPGACP